MFFTSTQLRSAPIKKPLAKIADNLKEVQPTIFTSVPRLLEKFYDRFISTGRKLNKIKKKIVDVLGRIYGRSHLLSLERSTNILKKP